MTTRYTSSLLLFLFLLPLITGCRQEKAEAPPKPELLIYCGSTMVQPIRQLADQLEQQQHCTVKIMINGSGNLYRSLKINQVGDLFLPGSAPYMEKCKQEGLVLRIVEVGINRAALIVQKGNPLGITADLHNMINPGYRTVLADPDTGSVGKEAQRILTKVGIYDQVMDHVLALTSDSKGLTLAIANDKADLTLNWLATTFWPENNTFVEALLLPAEIAPPHPLLLGLLKFSSHPELAGQFMDLASSPKGKKIFSSYGFDQ